MPEKIDPNGTMFFNRNASYHKNSVIDEINSLKNMNVSNRKYKFLSPEETITFLNEINSEDINKLKDTLN